MDSDGSFLEITLRPFFCLFACVHVLQECVFERLDVKQNVFQDIERLAGKDVILSSSTSCLVPSDVFSKVQNRSRCLVSHPVSAPTWHQRF